MRSKVNYKGHYVELIIVRRLLKSSHTCCVVLPVGNKYKYLHLLNKAPKVDSKSKSKSNSKCDCIRNNKVNLGQATSAYLSVIYPWTMFS